MTNKSTPRTKLCSVYAHRLRLSRRMSSFTHVAENKVQPADVAGAENCAVAGPAPAKAVSGYSPRLRGAAAAWIAAGPPPRGLFEVLKFGGSSMGSASRIAKVLDTIDRACREHPDKRFAVVVSAGGSTTDLLLTAADYASEGEHDRALAVLDQISSNQLSNAFEANSVPSELPPRSGPDAEPEGPKGESGTTMQTMMLDDTSSESVSPVSKKRKRQEASNAQSQHPSMPRDFVPKIRRTFEPLRKIMEGMALFASAHPKDWIMRCRSVKGSVDVTHLPAEGARHRCRLRRRSRSCRWLGARMRTLAQPQLTGRQPVATLSPCGGGGAPE